MRVWSHGYNVEVPYTYGYYKETSPLWIKWATYLGGRKPPKDEKIRVLELGCGQGYNLCMHASAFPNAEFLGIDFNPSHISHAEELTELTGLKNIKFIEGDFVELKNNFPKEYGKFHYVILHGIWTWISKNVRQAVVEILREVVLPGGLVYLSYNCQPGWLVGSIIREVLSNYYRMTQKPVLQAIEEGFNILKSMEEMNALVFRALPQLKNRLETVTKQDRNYIVHEFINEAHKIFWVYEVIEEVMPAKLYYAASANLTDNYLPALLPENMRNFINSFPHPVFRLFLIDLFINQAFRRDIYQKGELRPFQIEQIQEIKNVKLICKEEPPKEFKFQIGIGEVEGKREIYEPIMEELSKGERTIDQLLKAEKTKNIGIAPLVQALTMLLSKDLISLFNENNDISYTQSFNQSIAKLVCQGRPYNFLVSPITGIGFPVSNLEMIMLNLLSEGLYTVEQLSSGTLYWLKQQGRSLLKDGKPIENPKDEAEHMMELSKEFYEKRLPKLRSLKVIP